MERSPEHITALLEKLSHSKFRSRFKLDENDRAYIARVGLEHIESHAYDFITTRLAPQTPKNDGKQTPYKGHPVFKAQHATATCCRSCLAKWHRIPKNKALNSDDIAFAVRVIMDWIRS